ncbi:hypothetical protein [Siminovitchia fortis]|uniref:hypothetical protein n=1 Tax=Siminovitchia fortis TaxID=254758 RepID=UPI001642B3AD|nr:hypothetical protein [Siminovitchia fortis]
MKSFELIPSIHKGEKNKDGKEKQRRGNVNWNQLHKPQHIKIKADDEKKDHQSNQCFSQSSDPSVSYALLRFLCGGIDIMRKKERRSRLST